MVSDGPLGCLRSWRGGLQELSSPPPRSAGARPSWRRPFGFHPRSPALPHPAKGPISEPVTKPVPRSVLRVLKVVSAARALNVICAEPMWLKCFCRDQLPIHAWPGCTHYDPSFSGTCPEPSGSEQPSGVIIDGLGTRCGRLADDHSMNSPSSGQHTAHYSPVIIAPFVAWGRRGSLPLFLWSGGREASGGASGSGGPRGGPRNHS